MKNILVTVLALFFGAFCYSPVSAVVDPGLGVTQISAVKTFATADGTYENGWKWIFDVTVPTNETILKMKFANWVNGASNITAGDNIRFYSAQSVNAADSGHAISMVAANTYSAAINIVPGVSSDLDSTKAGRQIQIVMETRVPVGSVTGSYSTSYGINTEVDPTVSDSEDGNIENYITVTGNTTPASGVNLYESDVNIPVMGINIKANNSAMVLNRVKLGFNYNPENYFKNISLVDGNTEVSRGEINSNTVSYEGGYYTTTLGVAGVNISEDTTKPLIVRLSANDMINSSLTVPATIAINVVANGIRAADRLGVDNYGPASPASITNNVVVNYATVEMIGVSIVVSANANTPKSRNIIADSSEDIVGATLMSFDVKASKGTLLIDTIADVAFTTGANVYQIPDTVYLVDDSGMVIGTMQPNAITGKGSFTDLNYMIAKDNTKTFSIKIDDNLSSVDAVTRVAAEDGRMYVVAVDGTKITGSISNGASITGTGSAVSNAAYVYGEGPVFTISSISTSNTQAPYSGASSTITATFNVQVAAVTGDVYIPAANTAAFGITAKTGAFNDVVTDITYIQPSGTTFVANAYKIAAGYKATFAVTATKSTATRGAGTYDLRMNSIAWGHKAAAPSSVSSIYMANETSWISSAVYLR